MILLNSQLILYYHNLKEIKFNNLSRINFNQKLKIIIKRLKLSKRAYCKINFINKSKILLIFLKKLKFNKFVNLILTLAGMKIMRLNNRNRRSTQNIFKFMIAFQVL